MLCLISGGGSALLALPAEASRWSDKQAINKALLNSGATIGEMNCVRKHLSAIKGGRLALACAPARVVTLLISDVPGDDPADHRQRPDGARPDHLRRRAGDPAQVPDRGAAPMSSGISPTASARRRSPAIRALRATAIM